MHGACTRQLRRGDDNEHFCRFHRRRRSTPVYLQQRRRSVRAMERSVPAIKVMAHEKEEREKEEETETERDRGTKRNYNGPMTRHFSSNRTPAPATTHLEGLAAISSNPPAWCHFIGRWRAKIVNPRADDGGLSPFSSCMTLGFLYVGPVAFFSLGVLNHPNPLLGLSESCSLWRSTTLHDSAMYSSCPEVENTSRERSAASMTGDFFLPSSPSLL